MSRILNYKPWFMKCKVNVEKIPAGRAMDCSIELDKSLRSKRYPGRTIETITKIGDWLIRWSSEPEPPPSVCNLFGLLPGEERLFGNAILLRLVDAFRFRDRNIRVSVVYLVLAEYKSRCTRKRGKYGGILSRTRVHNATELIKRIRFVFYTGTSDDNALVLVLFGCWASFAKDSAHVRYLIHSSLVSPDVMEVKASLFAAG